MATYTSSYSGEQIEEAIRKAFTSAEDIGQVEFDDDLTELFYYADRYLDKSGKQGVSDYDNAGVTDYIAANPGDKFVWSGAIDIKYNYAVCEYDANKNFLRGSDLVTAGYTMAYNVPYTVQEGTYVRFCTLYRNKSNLTRTRDFRGITVLVDKTAEYNTTKGYLEKGTGKATDEANSILTDFIPAIAGDCFKVTCRAQYNTCGCAFYNTSKGCIGTTLYNADKSKYTADNEIVIAPTNTAFVRFCSYMAPLKVLRYEPLNLRHSDYRLYNFIEELQRSNVLYGKKYVACGDSFTHGGFAEKTDETWDNTLNTFKTYPWHIAKRNSMTLVNEAQSGSDFTNISGASNPFSVDRYLAVPADADYITLMFGLNETGLTESQIGTKTDTTNETLWGAYNIVFTHFLTNMPFAKIGVIIADAWMPNTYAAAVREICTYWGIPYLDLKGDNIPMGIGGKHSDTNVTAKNLRNAAFQVSSSDSHPNPKAHAYRSTIIENFLRSL